MDKRGRWRICRGVCAIVSLVVGLLLVTCAVVLGTYGMGTLVPRVEKQLVDQMATLLPGHLTYKQWKKPTVELYKDIYFFNLTNPEEFEKGATPVVKQVGPYRYRETRIKTPNKPRGYNHTEGNTLMPYTQRKYFNFDRESTPANLNEDDIITTINFPLVAATAIAERKGTVVRDALLVLLEGLRSKIHFQGKVKELTWNFTDSLLKDLHTVGQVPSPYFSIQLNDSAADQEESVVHTGTDDIRLLCKFKKWNGMETLSIWFGEEANELKGTEGLFFHPFIERGEPLEAFVDDVWRSFHLNYSGDTERLGIPVYRYKLDQRQFWSAHHYRRNGMYGSWCPDGLMYMGVTQNPAVPAFASKPHFLDGDPSLLQDVKGLHPDPAKHDIVVEVEPITGANVFVQRQLQINFQANRSDFWPQLKNIKGTNGTLYFPVMYVNENGGIGEATKELLEQNALVPLAIFTDVGWSLVGLLSALGVACLVTSTACCLCMLPRCCGKQSTYTVIENSTSFRHIADEEDASSKDLKINDISPLLT